ncbi:Nose resistant to fluoxetine protein 6-like protein [Leptotrombidium deliense]|uniref:Nose resistant to fluoxetine protein 6-like protein n=1 Tax=Leptotrombidium deliense TaxID=299467 RepID=A0A443S9Y2_9ACAR|nr:Nose resistant to fluoxetine protein 6-like protein [Leptotrombidium deliense]
MTSSDLWPMKDVALSTGAQLMTKSALQFESLIIITGFCMGYYNEGNGAWKAFKLVVHIKTDINANLKQIIKCHRIMPIVMVATGMLILLPLTKNIIQAGPVWTDYVAQPSEACQKYGYLNLFFVQNFSPPDQMCLQQTWLFCVELQLALVFIPVMSILSRFRVISWVLLGIIATIGFIINVVTVNNYELPPTLMWTLPDPEDRNYYYHKHFFMPWAHLSAWTIGVAMGHYCHNRNNNDELRFPKSHNVSYSKCTRILGCVVAAFVMLGLILLWPSWVLGNIPSPLSSGFYDGFSKILWAMCTAFLLYVFSVKVEEEKQSLVTRFLSSKFCIIMGRLTLVAFVVHPIVQIVFLGTQQTQVFSSYLVAGYALIGNTVFTYILSFILAVLFELPSSSLLTARQPSYSVLEENKNININASNIPTLRNGDIEMTKERF